MTKHVRRYDFGPFRVDLARRLLIRDGIAVSLTPKAFDILVLLIRKRGTVVDKDVLIREIWRGAVIEESNIPRNISMLRKALGDEPGLHRYIVTVPGLGYQFAEDVIDITDAGDSSGATGFQTAAQEPAPHADTVATARSESRSARPSTSAHAVLERPRVPRWVAVSVVLVGVAAVAIAVAGRHTSSAGEGGFGSPQIWQLTFASGLEGEPTWSPDGRMVAYSSERNGNLGIWVQSIEGSDPVQVTTAPEHDWQPDWSTNNRLAFRSERAGGGLFVVPALGGMEEQIAPFGYHPRWSPDGTRILFQSSNVPRIIRGSMELFTVSMDGRAPEKVLPAFLDQFIAYSAAWHPDSRRISVWGVHVRDGLTFWTVPLDGGTPPVRSEMTDEVRRRFAESGVSFRDADGVPLPFLWSPAGDALYFEGAAQGVRNLWRVPVHRSTLQWSGAPQRLTTSAGLNESISLSRDGLKLAFAVRHERTRLWSFPRDATTGRIGDRGQPITAASIDALSPVLSRDGTTLVYEVERGGRQELWEKSLLDGRESRLVAGDTYTRISPIWSDDDARVAYVRGRRAANSLVVDSTVVSIAASGGREQTLQTHVPVARLFDWSSDGRWVLACLQERTNNGYQLAIVPVDGRSTGGIRVIATDRDSNLWKARLAPDQRSVAFTRATGPGTSAIYVVPVDGGEPVQITTGAFIDDRPRWSADSRMIYFLSNRSEFLNVWVRRFEPATRQPVGELTQVTHFDSLARIIPSRMVQVGVAVAPDRVIVPLSETSSDIWVLDGLNRIPATTAPQD